MNFLFEDKNHQLFMNHTASLQGSGTVFTFTTEYLMDVFEGKETPVSVYAVYDPDGTYINGDEVVSKDTLQITLGSENNLSFTINN